MCVLQFLTRSSWIYAANDTTRFELRVLYTIKIGRASDSFSPARPPATQLFPADPQAFGQRKIGCSVLALQVGK